MRLDNRPGSSLTTDADSGTVFGFLEKKSVMGIPGLLCCLTWVRFILLIQNTQNDRSSVLSASSAIEFAESLPTLSTLDLSVVYWGGFGHMLNNNYRIMSDRHCEP